MRKIESSGNTDLRHAVKLLCRRQVSAERLFDNDACILCQFRGTEPLDHRLEEHGRDGEVVGRTLCARQCLFDFRERGWVLVVSAYVSEQGQKLVEGALVINSARSRYAVAHSVLQLCKTPLFKGDADDRDLQHVPFHQRIEGREDHLVGEIARHAEEHQGVRLRGRHYGFSFIVSSQPPEYPARRNPLTR